VLVAHCREGWTLMVTSVFVVVGNPKPNSRTFVAASEVGRRLASAVTPPTGSAEPTVVDLIDVGAQFFEAESPTVKELVEQVCAASVVVFASPTYKATFTGLLKLFLDQMPSNALAGVVAIPMMVAGAPIHALAVDSLRAVLIEVGASCPTPGLFVTESQLADLTPVMDAWLEQARFGLSLARGLATT
jgi:FMN reductase